jgi:hypothetical protein
MGIQRSIELHISSEDKNRVDLLHALVKDDWTPYNPDGQVEYTALGDVNDFDYATTSNIGTVYGVLAEKEKRKETGSIILWDKNHTERLSVLMPFGDSKDYRSEFKIVFGIGVGKRVFEGSRNTDFTYYLKRLLPIIQNEGFTVIAINCLDIG